eukprot:CAMPEP_0182458310 /NCGR_PEP_ID=MMETSP1319-20130603/3686_1 /TAXON_ID=172717 /ORGANISM="Bolidomonas pacifica, Strain RCC208" /LENGTH=301 /DNA_ID=CAMNT_0024656975 /DNA_START=27 /DNA_END=929 /DNA_ORIENTATION=+
MNEIDLSEVVVVEKSPPLRIPSGSAPPPSSPPQLSYTQCLNLSYLQRTDSLLLSLSRSFTSFLLTDICLFLTFLIVFLSSPASNLVFLFSLPHLPRFVLGLQISSFVFPDALDRLSGEALDSWSSEPPAPYSAFFKSQLEAHRDDSATYDAALGRVGAHTRRNRLLAWTSLSVVCAFLDFCSLMITSIGPFPTPAAVVCFVFSLFFFVVDLGLFGTLAQPSYHVNGGRFTVAGVWGGLFSGEGLFPTRAGQDDAGGGKPRTLPTDDEGYDDGAAYDMSRNLAAMQGDLGVIDTRSGAKLQQ